LTGMKRLRSDWTSIGRNNMEFRRFRVETCSSGRVIFRMTWGLHSFLKSIEMKFHEI
jgi:hypothetical protein